MFDIFRFIPDRYMKRVPVTRVGVGCFVIDATNPKPRTLIMERQNTSHGNGEWSLPGGKVEHMESFTDAVYREVLEETGLTVVSIKPLCFTDDKWRSKGLHFATLFYTALSHSHLFINREPHKCREMRWLELPEQAESINDSFQAFDEWRTLRMPEPLMPPLDGLLDSFLTVRTVVEIHREAIKHNGIAIPQQ